MAPMHDDPLTQMGLQLVDADLKMDCALLVEVDDAAQKDQLHDRMTIAENRTRTAKYNQNGKKLVTERLLRIATYNYHMNRIAHPIFKEVSMRMNRLHEEAPGDVDGMEQQANYVPSKNIT